MPEHRPDRRRRIAINCVMAAATALIVVSLVYPHPAANAELPNRIPEAAPYITAEAESFAPPFEESWQRTNHPGQCQTCHARIFEEWNGSMMANAWRDPAWRAAFLLSARQISTRGNCDAPSPPDGTAKAGHNPFAGAGGCTTSFDLGTSHFSMSRPGSLVDGFCSRCHMPTNYVDNVPLQNVAIDRPSGLEHGAVDVNFNPTADNGTGLAFATLDSQWRNTDSGKSGVACMVCHSLAGTRETPFHNQAMASDAHPPAAHHDVAAPVQYHERDVLDVPDRARGNLGYGVGGGAFQLSPHAIGFPERLGPLTSAGRPLERDAYLSEVFKTPTDYQAMDASKHEGSRRVLSTRAEFCSTCHDVTNHLTIKNALGKWVGGFPIERTYAEWASSRYADRPGNPLFDPAFKRDCQTCHMQQDYGQPGTARTLYPHGGGAPIAPLAGRVATDGTTRTYFSHHFVGGNAYVPRMIGGDLDETGNVQRYPELSMFSFSSADERSVYSNAYWTNVGDRGTPTQQARLAWDRLLNVLDLDLSGPHAAEAGATVPIRVSVTNSGSGHNFPTGFPEGRTAWVAISAVDLASGAELPVHDAFWNRTSRGIGRFTTTDMVDPAFPACGWKIPAGSPDPYAYQFKAVATLGDDCPTLELVFATARNLVTNAKGLPIDARGVVIDRQNPRGLPIFRDLNGNGDQYDDAFLRDTRLRPLPHAGATVTLDRYAIVIPPGTLGPIALTAAVYYQSLEAIVAKKFLGNLADTDTDFVLEPCVLGGRCDGRRPGVEPPVVEGAPPVPMAVRNWVIRVNGAPLDPVAPQITVYPQPGGADVFPDVVVKASFSEPVTNVNAGTFTLSDAAGALVPASVHQIGDGTWGLFPDQVFLKGGDTYTARLAAGICGQAGTCTSRSVAWSYRVASQRAAGVGDTTIPLGFRTGLWPLPSRSVSTSAPSARRRGAPALPGGRPSPSLFRKEDP